MVLAKKTEHSSGERAVQIGLAQTATGIGRPWLRKSVALPIFIPSESSAESYIRNSEAQWAEAVANGDVSAVQRILADDFIGVMLAMATCMTRPRRSPGSGNITASKFPTTSLTLTSGFSATQL